MRSAPKLFLRYLEERSQYRRKTEEGKMNGSHPAPTVSLIKLGPISFDLLLAALLPGFIDQ